MRLASSLLLFVACKASDPDKTGTDGTPTDGSTDTTDTDTGTGLPTTERPTTTTTTDPCDEPLVATIPQPGVLARQDLRVEASGGSGDVRFSLRTNASGASINAISGNYLAGPAYGVTDTVQVDDEVCGLSATVDIEVFLPLEVVPTVATLAPGTSFTIEVAEGSGSWRCEDGLIQSGGGLAAGTCTYTAGSNLGLDQLFVVDELTDERVELAYTISDDLRFEPWAEVWLLPAGHPHTPRMEGGSGALDISPPAGLSWDGQQLTGTADGTYALAITDRFTGQSTSVDVVVAAPRSPADIPKDGERSDWFDTAWGDLNDDGYDDVVLATVDGGVAGFLGGGIYVFLGSATGLEDEPAQVFGYPEPYGYGGRSVAVGDLDSDGILDLAWGAPGANLPGSADIGVVWIHKGQGDGTFDAEPTWERWGDYGGDQLGYALALCDVTGDGADDLVAVALRGEDRTQSPIVYDTGDLRVYVGNPGGPSLDPSYRAFGVYPDGAGDWTTRGASWGYRLASGDFDGDGACDVAVASYPEGPYDGTDYGVVWRYLASDLTGSAPVLPSRVYSSNTVSRFGRNLAVGDVDDDGLDDLLVGAYADDTLFTDGGAAYLFLAADDDGRDADALVTDLDASWQVDADGSYDYVGWGVALADLDGDGLDDVAVAASSDELYGGLSNTGVVAWFAASDVLGSSAAVMADAVELWAPDVQSQQFGMDLGFAGDVDGDGLGDLVAPAPRGKVSGPDTQRFYPLSQGVPTPYGTELPGDVRATLMGDRKSATFFDVDHDGDLDVVAGAWSQPIEGVGYNSGDIHVFDRSGSGWSEASDHPLAPFPGFGESDRLGWAVSSAGDFDGDGFEDLVVVAWNDTEPGTPDASYSNPSECPAGSNVGGVGSAWIHLGGPSGIDADPSFVVFGYEAYDHIERVAGRMDVDADGFDDLLVGSTGTGSNGGFAVVRGRASTPGGVTIVCDAEWVMGVTSSSRLGSDLAAAGDVDGDGCDDFVVGADADDLGRSNQGSLRLFWGDGVGCSGPAVTTLVVDQSNARFGDSVDGGLDADGDGVPDLVGGAYAYDDGLTDRGAAFWVDGAWAAGLARSSGWTLPADGSTTSHIVGNEGRILGEAARDESSRGVALVVDPRNPSRALVATGGRYNHDGAGGVSLWAIDGGTVAERPYALVGGETAAPWGQPGGLVAGHPDLPVLLVGAPFGEGAWIDQGAVYPFLIP